MSGSRVLRARGTMFLISAALPAALALCAPAPAVTAGQDDRQAIDALDARDEDAAKLGQAYLEGTDQQELKAALAELDRVDEDETAEVIEALETEQPGEDALEEDQQGDEREIEKTEDETEAGLQPDEDDKGDDIERADAGINE